MILKGKRGSKNSSTNQSYNNWWYLVRHTVTKTMLNFWLAVKYSRVNDYQNLPINHPTHYKKLGGKINCNGWFLIPHFFFFFILLFFSFPVFYLCHIIIWLNTKHFTCGIEMHVIHWTSQLRIWPCLLFPIHTNSCI